MKKTLLAKLVFVAFLATLLSGCIVVPGWEGHRGGGHHHGEFHHGHGGHGGHD